jgi:cyanophycinase
MATRRKATRAQKHVKRVESATRHPGTLIIIGGAEDKEGERRILREVARRADKGTLVVATVASEVADELWPIYERVFRELGVKHVEHLDVRRREDAFDQAHLDVLTDAQVVFFTGGDQLRIASRLGGTPVNERIYEIYTCGGTIAGTSAGASAMSETMLAAGPGAVSVGMREMLHLAPGLGFTRHMVIDQHFVQRGRIGRLLGAVAENPRLLGIGIDEDTAIVVEEGTHFTVIGSGSVYITDARGVIDSNISDATGECALSVFGVMLHVLAAGDSFDITTRMPSSRDEECRRAA